MAQILKKTSGDLARAWREAKDKTRTYGMELVDIVYGASVASVIAYAAILLFLLIIATAIGSNIVAVPEFHPN